MKEYVKTTSGTIPLEDYLDIQAMQHGFSSYEELKEEGLSIDIPETIVTVQINLGKLYEAGKAELRFGGTIKQKKEDGRMCYHLYSDMVPGMVLPGILLLSDKTEVIITDRIATAVAVEDPVNKKRLMFSPEEFAIAAE